MTSTYPKIVSVENDVIPCVEVGDAIIPANEWATLVDTGVFSKPIDIVTIVLTTNNRSMAFEIRLYRKDGTSVNIGRWVYLGTDALINADNVNKGNVQKVYGIFESVWYDTTYDNYIFQLRPGVILRSHGIKISAYNTASTSKQATVLVIYTRQA